MSNTQESPVGCLPCCSWFRYLGRGHHSETEPALPVQNSQNNTNPETHPLPEHPTSKLTALSPAGASSQHANSSGSRKSTFLAATKVLLQVAATGLNFVPIPNLGQIPSTLLQCIQIYESFDGNEENLKELVDTIQQAQDSIFRPLQLVSGVIPDEIRTITDSFCSDVNRQLESVQSLQARNPVLKAISTSDIAEEINKLRTRIQRAIADFNTSATTLNLIHAVRSSIEHDLSKLRKAQAEYMAVKSKSECLPSTRESIQESILNHLLRPENRFVWLRGSPGMGKTAISMSVASVLDQRRVLAASFFWDKNQADGLNSLDWFPSTLARQLAEFSPEYENVLVRHLRQLPLSKVEGFPLERQMKALILGPMDELEQLWSSDDDCAVIVLDGLDECGDSEALEMLMKLVLILDGLPKKFSVLVSCRPESQVLSTWKKASFEVPIENVDALLQDENFRTVRRMVEEGLKERVEELSWKPTSKEYDAFASACRELPVLATIRVRNVSYLTNHGSTLETEFLLLSDIETAPKDLDAEYLRILRRAFPSGPIEIPERVLRNYRQVVGTIVAAHTEISIDTMSHLLGKTPQEIRGTLNPIGSIVDLPSDDTEQVKFYHATMMEFITGEPKGTEKDKMFFIRDTKGYFLGLFILKYLNSVPKQLSMPTDPPFGDRNKWDKFMGEAPWTLPHIRYATEYLFDHLDPSQLSSMSGELWSEFDHFLNENFLSFLILYPIYRRELPKEIIDIDSAKLNMYKLRKEAKNALSSRYCHESILPSGSSGRFLPWLIYRSFLPFSRSSSMIHQLYAHLSDPVIIFSISGEFTGHSIPLTNEARHAQDLMQAQIRMISDDSGDSDDSDDSGTQLAEAYKNELSNDDIRGGTVVCAALSQDGKYVALSFGNGSIEVADISHLSTISQFRCEPPNLPVWIEFIHGHCRIAVEDNKGTVTIFCSSATLIELDPLPTGTWPPVTVVSHDQSMIARVPHAIRDGWYNDMRIMYVLEDPSIHCLAPPTPIAPSPGCKQNFLRSTVALPRRRSIGFSPGDRYIGAFDLDHAFIWSADSRAFIAHYHVTDFTTWMLNPCDDLSPSQLTYAIPTPIFDGRPYLSHNQSVEGSCGLDEEWLDHPFLDLTPSIKDKECRALSMYSSILGKVPVLATPDWRRGTLGFNGKAELTIPTEYEPLIVLESNDDKAWYGDRVLNDLFFLPRSSKDGTRILLQGKTRTPIIVDISKVV